MLDVLKIFFQSLFDVLIFDVQVEFANFIHET